MTEDRHYRPLKEATGATVLVEGVKHLSFVCYKAHVFARSPTFALFTLNLQEMEICISWRIAEFSCGTPDVLP